MKDLNIRLLNTDDIPFKEKSKEWHIMVDIHTAVDSENNVSLLDLCTQHDLSPRYYSNLSNLVEMKLIEITPFEY